MTKKMMMITIMMMIVLKVRMRTYDDERVAYVGLLK